MLSYTVSYALQPNTTKYKKARRTVNWNPLKQKIKRLFPSLSCLKEERYIGRYVRSRQQFCSRTQLSANRFCSSRITDNPERFDSKSTQVPCVPTETVWRERAREREYVMNSAKSSLFHQNYYLVSACTVHWDTRPEIPNPTSHPDSALTYQQPPLTHHTSVEPFQQSL